MTTRQDRAGWVPAALTLEDATYHFRVGATKWREWVERGVMPQARVRDGIVIWDTSEYEIAFRAVPHRGEAEPSLVDQMRL